MSTGHLYEFQNVFSLEGKVAVVTGGSQGLGFAAASGMLQHGLSKVFITARTASKCEDAVAALNALTNKASDACAYSVPADSSTTAGVQGLVDAVAKITDHVDILLVNAGAAHPEKFETHNEEQWDKVMDINLKSAFYTVQKFLPLLTAQASIDSTSRVIMTSSVAGNALGTIGEHATYSYSIAKAGVIHMAKQLAVDLGPRHVLTNTIAPGFFTTELAMPLINAQGGIEAVGKTYPNGRLGKMEDFAGTVVWLSSRAGGHVNGQTITLDGGGTIGRIRP